MIDYEAGYLRAQQNFRKKIISLAIIIIALVVFIFLIYFLFLAPVKDKVITEKPNQVDIQEQVVLPVQNNFVARPVERANPTESELKRISSSFVENYGTYSNQASYQNIKDLKIFMSQSMQKWSQDFINDMISKNSNNNIYYGITTTAVVVNTQRFDEIGGVAEFLINTQRVESVGTNSNNRKFQQDAVLKMIKEKGVWKVDRLTWNE